MDLHTIDQRVNDELAVLLHEIIDVTENTAIVPDCQRNRPGGRKYEGVRMLDAAYHMFVRGKISKSKGGEGSSISKRVKMWMV